MDNREYERLYEEYYPKVLRYLSSRVSIAEDAENLAQDVFLKLYAKADLYDETKSSISTWIFNITRNTLTDHQRSMAYRRHEELPAVIVDDSKDILGDIIAEEQLELLADALEQLEEEERRLVILHYYSGCTLTKIAETLDRPYGQVKRLHNKALQKLKLYMAAG